MGKVLSLHLVNITKKVVRSMNWINVKYPQAPINNIMYREIRIYLLKHRICHVLKIWKILPRKNIKIT